MQKKNLSLWAYKIVGKAITFDLFLKKGSGKINVKKVSEQSDASVYTPPDYWQNER